MSPSRYASNPDCDECGKRKGPKQLNNKRCFRCGLKAKRETKERRHGTRIQATYGIDKATYNLLLAFQGGKCFICQRSSGRTKHLAVDHDHKCEAGHAPANGCPECTRGLLCSICNGYIGRMRDDPVVGERMARYLREPPYQMLRREMPEAA